MCLLKCWNTFQKEGCRGLCPDCACVSCLAIFVLAPLGLLVGAFSALFMGLLKWIPGSYQRVSHCCACYCEVINKGQEQYDIEDGRTRPPQDQQQRGGRSFADIIERQSRATGSKCAGEMYCCCLPAFWLLMVFYPVWILLELLICNPVYGACDGMNAGCHGVSGYKMRMRLALLSIDKHTSQAAFGVPTPWWPMQTNGQSTTTGYAAGMVAQPRQQAAPPVSQQPGFQQPVPQPPPAKAYVQPPQPPPVQPVAYAQPASTQPVAYAQPVAYPPPQGQQARRY